MAYVIRAVIAAQDLLTAAASEITVAGRQGFALMPVTDEVFDAVTDGGDKTYIGTGRGSPRDLRTDLGLRQPADGASADDVDSAFANITAQVTGDRLTPVVSADDLAGKSTSPTSG